MSDSVQPHRCSPPGFPVPGILQAKTLEWLAISFSNAWKWKVKVKSLSHVRLFATPWTAAYQAPPSMGFSRQEYWSGVPSPSLVPLWETHNQLEHYQLLILAFYIFSFVFSFLPMTLWSIPVIKSLLFEIPSGFYFPNLYELCCKYWQSKIKLSKSFIKVYPLESKYYSDLNPTFLKQMGIFISCHLWSMFIFHIHNMFIQI